jgi:hypothetical protein
VDKEEFEHDLEVVEGALPEGLRGAFVRDGEAPPVRRCRPGHAQTQSLALTHHTSPCLQDPTPSCHPLEGTTGLMAMAWCTL